MTVYLSLEDLLVFCEKLGVGPVRDLGLLESASHRPQAAHFGKEAYASLDQKAAALLHSILRNHALVDGNKRLAWVSLIVFYRLNDVLLDVPDDPAHDFVVDVSTRLDEITEIARGLADIRSKWQTK